MKRTALSIIFLVLYVSLAYTQHQFDIPRLSPMVKTVAGVADPVIPLNGQWTFHTASVAPSPIEVPGEWIMQGFNVPEEETACYSRMIRIPGDWEGKRVKIRFDGVSSYGLVKVNGRVVGEHEGGMVPFELDITRAVKSGDNELMVEVRAGTISDRLSCISQYACHTVGGLVRKVTLFVLPEVNIASMDVVTTLDKSCKHAELHISTQLEETATLPATATINYQLKDQQGKTVAVKKQDLHQAGIKETKLTVRNARLWNSEQPYLYTLTTFLTVDGKEVQTNEQRIGLRQVEVKGNLLYVNGKPVKLWGVNRHEAHPLRGRSLTPELCRKDAELFKAGNCNYIRTSHYPPSEEFLEACDEIGLYVESEAALNWIQHHASPIWKNWDYQDEQYLPYMLRANTDNVLAGRKHPSVIIWSLGNESRWSPLWEKVRQHVGELDPSRPNSFHDQCWGGFNNAGSTADIANIHYPGINGPAACDTMSRPTLFGEYAHLTCYNSRELVTDPGVRAAYGKYLVEYCDSMYYHPACLGGAIWSGIDDIFHLPGGRIVGYGPWGPIDGWRREKPEYTGMKKAYTPFRIVQEEWKTGRLVLTVENRYNFMGFNELLIEAGEKGGKMTRVKSTIPAGSKGKVIIPLKETDMETIYLKVADPQGRVCHEELFASGMRENEKTEEENTMLETEDIHGLLKVRMTKNGDNQTIVFNKTTGVITHAWSGNKTLLRQGPVFCLAPMNSDDGGKPNVAGETYQNMMPPLRDYPHLTLFAKDFRYGKDDKGNIVVEIEAAYQNGDTGKIVYTFGKDHRIRVNYEMKLAAEKTTPRQYGLLFQLPEQMEVLTWKRKGEFTVYPEYDIARTEGTARLNANRLYEVESHGNVPDGAWKDDANILGSVDFRSTKTQLLKGSLLDNAGNGIIIHSDGTQAWRSWLQDGSIHLLVAGYSNTGSERFYSTPFTRDRITLGKGDTVKGEVVFELR